MNIKKQFLIKSARLLFTVLFITLCLSSPALSYPIEFTDSGGKIITIDEKPIRVLSLVPSITEIIFKIGAGDSIKAVTYNDTYPGAANSKKIVGGFFSPSLKAIKAVQPDIIFLSGLHKKVMEKFGHGKCKLINLQTNSISESYKNIILLGKIFNKEKKATAIVDEIKNRFKVIEIKISKIPTSKRQRVFAPDGS